MSFTPGDGDDRDAVLLERRGERDDFFGLARVGKGDDKVARADAPEVAVDGLGGVDLVGGDAETGEGGRNFASDEAALAHAGDEDGAAGVGAVDDEIDGGVDLGSEALDLIADRPGFGAQDTGDEIAFGGAIRGWLHALYGTLGG